MPVSHPASQPAAVSKKVRQAQSKRVKIGDDPKWLKEEPPKLAVTCYETSKLITLTTATWLMILVD